MRFWLSLVILALVSCGNSNSDQNNAEIARNQSKKQNPVLARANRSDIDQNPVSARATRSDVAERSTLSAAEFLAIREHLTNSDFNQLNELLAHYAYEHTENSANEHQLVDAYLAFQLSGPQYLPVLENWIKNSPQLYQPYLAAAQFHFQRGWTARGTTYMNKVSAENKALFFSELENAAKLARAAIEIKNDVLPAYLILIQIEKSISGYEHDSPIASMAFDIFPDSLELRIAEIEKYQPRWGGSYRKMKRFADNAIASQPNEPRFEILLGKVDIEKSRIDYSDSNYEKSLSNANKAIAHGEYAQFYYRRAKVKMALDEFPASLEDINKAIALRPAIHDHYLQRAQIFIKMGDYAAAMADYDLATLLNIEDQARIDRSKKWAANAIAYEAAQVFSTNPNQSIAFYDDALKFYGNHQDSVYWRAMAFVRLGSTTEAIDGFEHSIRIDPKHFDSYRQLDFMLVKQGRMNEIVANWDTFLELVPDHANGYLERAGAHHHDGRESLARADLERACELSSAKACAIIASLDAR